MNPIQAEEFAVYIDRNGHPHNSLVLAVNLLHADHITLVYSDNGQAVTVQDIPHMSHESRRETNPDLPSFPLNCWRHVHEQHETMPVDHPHYDHPHRPSKTDDMGRIIPHLRPHWEARKKEHLGVSPEVLGFIDALKADAEALTGVQPGTLPPEPDVTTQLDSAGVPPVEAQGDEQPPQ